MIKPARLPQTVHAPATGILATRPFREYQGSRVVRHSTLCSPGRSTFAGAYLREGFKMGTWGWISLRIERDVALACPLYLLASHSTPTMQAPQKSHRRCPRSGSEFCTNWVPESQNIIPQNLLRPISVEIYPVLPMHRIVPQIGSNGITDKWPNIDSLVKSQLCCDFRWHGGLVSTGACCRK
jgi:hypothetical protein